MLEIEQQKQLIKHYKNDQTNRNAIENNNKQNRKEFITSLADLQEAFAVSSSMHLTQFSFNCKD